MEKVVLVTGGGTGIGRATAMALSEKSFLVVVNYRSSADDAHQTVAQIERNGGRAAAIQADVASDMECRKLVEQTLEKFGRLDILVNNAGHTSFVRHSDLEGLRDADWSRIMDVNVKGAFQCSRAAYDALAESHGSIVNVSSIAGLRGGGSSIAYAASKAALNNLTVNLARSMAPKVRVNAVAPGFVDSRWLRKGLGDRYDAVKEGWERLAPLGRVCQPEDVAQGIMMLVECSMVTGHVLPIEGGMLIAN